MPTVGNTSTAGNDTWVQNTGSNNQQAQLITMPEPGLIKTLHVYFSGNGATMTAQLCLWNSSGTLIGQSGNFTASAGTTGINGQHLQSADLITPFAAASGQQLYIGFWRATGSTCNFSYNSGGGTIRPQTLSGVSNVGSPSSLTVSSGTAGTMVAYADYVTGGLAMATSGTFHKYAPKRYDAGSTTWKRHPLKKWSSSAGAWQWFA